jgi:hypothetical protein
MATLAKKKFPHNVATWADFLLLLKSANEPNKGLRQTSTVKNDQCLGSSSKEGQIPSGSQNGYILTCLLSLKFERTGFWYYLAQCQRTGHRTVGSLSFFFFLQK